MMKYYFEVSLRQRMHGQVIHIHRLELRGAVKPSWYDLGQTLSHPAMLVSHLVCLDLDVNLIGPLLRQIARQDTCERFRPQMVLLLGWVLVLCSIVLIILPKLCFGNSLLGHSKVEYVWVGETGRWGFTFSILNDFCPFSISRYHKHQKTSSWTAFSAATTNYCHSLSSLQDRTETMWCPWASVARV